VHHSARAESALPIRTGIIDVIFLYATQQFCTIRPGYVSYRHLTTPDIAPLGPAERHDLLQLGPLKSGAKAIDDDEAAGGTKPRELDSIVFLSNEALFALKPSRILFHRPCVCFSGPKTVQMSQSRSKEGVSFWNPPWLRTGTLLGLATLFACLIASLVAIFVTSEQRHGLSSPQSKYRYAWTYGPTISEFAV
jgi:hypothetical protein